MKNYFVYVLYSPKFDHWYIGSTSNLSRRLVQHNKGSSFSTKPYCPWIIVYNEKYFSRATAVRRELYLKAPQGYVEHRSIKDRVKIQQTNKLLNESV